MPKSLAEIVLEEGLATSTAVQRAAEVSDRDGVPIVVALVRECGIDEVAVVAALKRHCRVALGDPATLASEPDAVREIARDMCQRLRVVPLEMSSYDGHRRVLRLGMADPTDTVAIAEIEHHTGCGVEPVLMTLSAVEELGERSYRHFVTEVMRREPSRPTKVAGTPRGSGRAAAASAENRSPATVPYHRLSDEVGVELRLRAVMDLLLDKQLISEDELEEKVRELMQRRDSDR